MATRLYFVANTAASVSPSFAAWNSTANAVRRTLSTTKAATTETISGTCANAASSLAVQAVSPPLDAQTIAGTNLINLVSRGRELAGTDNIDKRYRCVKVYSGDGTTLRGTLIAYSATASTSELTTSFAGQTHNLNSGPDPVVCSAGDVLVVEVGYGVNVSGTSPNWEMQIGGNGTDHANSNGDTTGSVMWIEFSENLTFQAVATDLTVAEATQAHTADNVTLTQVHVLVVAEARSTHTVDNLTLAQVHNLTVADATQAHTVDNLTLTQVHNLVVADASHAQAADNVTVTLVVESTDLTVADASQGHSVDNVTLTQVHALTVADTAQVHSVDNVALAQTHVLAVQDASHGQTVDAVDLGQTHILAVGDATQAQTAETVVLDEVALPGNLVVRSAIQGHSVDNVTLTQVHMLAPVDATQAHTAESPTLTQVHMLAVPASTLAQAADTVALTQLHELAVEDTSHGHRAWVAVWPDGDNVFPDRELTVRATGATTTSRTSGTTVTGRSGRVLVTARTASHRVGG